MDKVLHEIRVLEKNEDRSELGSYLINLVKNDNNALKYEFEFAKHLQSDDWYLKKAAVFALLFVLKIDNPKYRDAACTFVTNSNEDEEVRRWSASGLGLTYEKTKDKELLKLLMSLMDSNEEDYLRLKISFLSSALLIYGLSAREQFLRSSSISGSIARMKELFDNEIKLIREEICD